MSLGFGISYIFVYLWVLLLTKSVTLGSYVTSLNHASFLCKWEIKPILKGCYRLETVSLRQSRKRIVPSMVVLNRRHHNYKYNNDHYSPEVVMATGRSRAY